MANPEPTLVICVRNDDYPASLEVRKIYRSLPEPDSERRGLIRVVDESGEDYLYPADHFVAVELPEAVVRRLPFAA